MPLVLVVMLLVFSVGGVLISRLAITVREGNTYKNYQQAVLYGKNAVEECHAALALDPSYTGVEYTDETGVVTSIRVQRVSAGERYITITVTGGEYMRKYTGSAVYSDTGILTAFSAKLI